MSATESFLCGWLSAMVLIAGGLWLRARWLRTRALLAELDTDFLEFIDTHDQAAPKWFAVRRRLTPEDIARLRDRGLL